MTTNASIDRQAEANSSENGKRTTLLDPVDRISEILFGLIMAVTIVGSLSVATAGNAEVRTVMAAALGCNLAWGLVDAVMYVVRSATERTRNRRFARQIIEADAATGRRLIAQAMPAPIAAIAGDDALEGMRQRLLERHGEMRGVVRTRDLLEACGIFAMVVVATFPVVLPFLLMDDARSAMRVAQGIALVMLFGAGFALGRHAGYAKPLRTGLAMAFFGALLITVVKALGG